MKKKIFALLIVSMLLLVGFLAVDADKPDKTNPKPGTDFNGPHFNLNLIGKNKEMPGDKNNSDRHTMFVPLDTSGMSFDINTPNNLNNQTTMEGIKIEITQSSSEDGWAMIDGDATDGYGAFELAAGKYYVYIAVKAKSPKYPNAYTNITGWVEALDNLGNKWYYIDVGFVQVSKGKNKWTDGTDLFFVTTGEDDFGFLIGNESNYIKNLGMWVFEYMGGLDAWYDDPYGEAPYDLSDLAYFWQFVNSGNKLIQVRFYPM
jgi:hypothetical protein